MERDLETLLEIVALKFIGVPLGGIAAIRRRSRGSFVDVLHAQRDALEARRTTLTRAIAAVAAAETWLRSGSAIDAGLFRQIIEVMHMDANHEATIAKYTALLRAKVSHLSAMSTERRATLLRQWRELIEEVTAALDEDPARPQSAEPAGSLALAAPGRDGRRHDGNHQARLRLPVSRDAGNPRCGVGPPGGMDSRLMPSGKGVRGPTRKKHAHG